jgi:hypothetical protein
MQLYLSELKECPNKTKCKDPGNGEDCQNIAAWHFSVQGQKMGERDQNLENPNAAIKSKTKTKGNTLRRER